MDSPKDFSYHPTSSYIEKRDSKYCKVIEKAKKVTLKSFRVKLDEEDTYEEDKYDFCGFSQDQAKENNDMVMKNVYILKERKQLINQVFKSSFYDKSTPSTST